MRRQGVIVGIDDQRTPQDCRKVGQALTRMFPGVTFAVGNGADSIAFEFDDSDAEPPPAHMEKGLKA